MQDQENQHRHPRVVQKAGIYFELKLTSESKNQALRDENNTLKKK